jgi:hypothetical protein
MAAETNNCSRKEERHCRSMAMLMASSLVLAACTGQAPPEPAISSARWQLAGPWRHVPTPVSDQQFKLAGYEISNWIIILGAIIIVLLIFQNLY